MKKIISLCLVLTIAIASLFATTTIKGDFSLTGELYLDSDFNISESSTSTIDLFLLSKSNNVKYTIKNSTDITTESDIENTIEQAYLQFRTPYKENYLTFSFGKIPLDIGGDWYFNSGTPFDYDKTSIFDEVDNPWIASVKTKLYETEDYKSINFEAIAQLPLEDGDSKIGGRLTYDINDDYFGTVETSFLTDYSSSVLSGGFNGNYFFDYGIYAKADLQELDDFEASIYLLKIYPSFTYKVEALYTNDDETLYIFPTVSYIANSKTTLSASLFTTFIDGDFNFSPYITYSFNILQGLDISAYYIYYSNNHNLSATITHKF